MTVALAVVGAALLAAVVLALGLGAALARTRAELAEARATIERLHADLDTALRPPPASTVAERAVRAVVGTAARVRRHGVTGLLALSLDDLTAWALEKRPDILEVAAPDGTVTLFFSDIEDSTALNDRLGDRTWVKVLEAHDAVVRAAVERRRGQVVKTAGDSFMVAFRDPTEAVRAARSIQRTLARTLDPRLRLTPVRVRIGVHTGRVISRDGDYFGTNVALAARIAALADGGEVLVSDAVATAVGTHPKLPLEDVGTVPLKGLAGEHRVWRLRWDAGRPLAVAGPAEPAPEAERAPAAELRDP